MITMQEIFPILFIIIFFFTFINFLIFLSYKFRIFLDNPQRKNHSLHNITIPRVLGVVFPIFLIFYYFLEYKLLFNLLIISILISFVGFLEDFGIKINPKLRLFIQFFTAFILLFLFNEYSLKQLDITNFIQSKFFYITLSAFFLTALINAFNFIDGLNGLCIFFSKIVLSIILIIDFKIEIFYFFVFLFVILIFNFPKPKSFLGDFGAYILGSFIGLYLIYIFNYEFKFHKLSEWFIANLLAYPVIDTSINILKRSINRKSPFVADNNHLHSLIYKNINNNSLSSILILLGLIIFSIPTILYKDNAIFLYNYFIIQIFIYSLLHIFLHKLSKQR